MITLNKLFRYLELTNAFKMMRNIFFILLVVAFFGCIPPTPPTPPENLIEVGDLEEIPELSEEEQEEDRDWIADYDLRKKQLQDLGLEDSKQKIAVIEQKKKIIESKSALKEEVDTILKARAEKKALEIFNEKIAGKIKKDSKISSEEIKELIVKASKGELEVEELKKILIEKLGISDEEVEAMISEATSKGKDVKKVLLKKILEETTTLSKDELNKVIQKVEKVATETNEQLWETTLDPEKRTVKGWNLDGNGKAPNQEYF